MKAPYKKLFTMRNIVLVLSGGVLLYFVSSRVSKITKIKQILKDLDQSLKINGYTEKVRNVLQAVARFESGEFTNTLSTKYNNIFSMGVPGQRDSTRSGEFALKGKDGKTRYFSTYESTQQGINDMLLYLHHFKYPKDTTGVNQWVTIMKSKGYFEEPYNEYLTGVISKL